MKTTAILTEEHRVIERVLNSLEIAAERLNRREEVPARFFYETTDFIRGFADGCHHKKEEDVLIKAMVANGMPADEGPIAFVLAEHAQGRALTQQMRDATRALEKGEASAHEDLIRSAEAYLSLLRNHIVKEDKLFFPMAERMIPSEAQEQVARDFDRVEQEETGRGDHEKYLALMEKLEDEMRYLPSHIISHADSQ